MIENNEELNALQNKKAIYQNIVVNNKYKKRNIYTIDAYSKKAQALIFNLKERKDLDISFKNKRDWICTVDKAALNAKNNVILSWHFASRPENIFHIDIERFLELVSKKEFHSVKPKEFKDAYLKPIVKELCKIDKDIINIIRKSKKAKNNK